MSILALMTARRLERAAIKVDIEGDGPVLRVVFNPPPAAPSAALAA